MAKKPDARPKGLGEGAATKNRVVRVSDPVWDAAMEKAAERGEVLAEEIRRFLVGYAELPAETPAVRGKGGGRDRPKERA